MKYLIDVEIVFAEGTQTFAVDADSMEEALEKYNRGEGDIEREEIDVYSLKKPTINDVYES